MALAAAMPRLGGRLGWRVGPHMNPDVCLSAVGRVLDEPQPLIAPVGTGVDFQYTEPHAPASVERFIERAGRRGPLQAGYYERCPANRTGWSRRGR